MGASGTKQALDEKGIAEQYHLTPAQVDNLVGTFKKLAPKGKVDKKKFHLMVAEFKQSFPELTFFSDEIVDLIFTFSDTDNSGKLDPLEVAAALSVYGQGSVDDKAKLVFKTIDKDHTKILTKEEISSHAKKISAFSAQLVKSDMKGAVKGFVGSMAAAAIGTALNAMTAQFVADVVRDVMTIDDNKDGYISEEEWLKGAQTNNTVKALIDPNLSANAWRTVFGTENVGGMSEDRVNGLMTSPKGFATIFDWQAESGVHGLGKQVPPPPPPNKKVTLAGNKGTVPVEVTPQTTYAQFIALANAAVTDIASDFVGVKGSTSLLNSNYPESAIYEYINDGETITVVPLKGWKGDINIKTLTGKTIPIKTSWDETIATVKGSIQDKEGIPPNQQRLIYGGKQLADDQKLFEVGVLESSDLHLVLRLSGV